MRQWHANKRCLNLFVGMCVGMCDVCGYGLQVEEYLQSLGISVAASTAAAGGSGDGVSASGSAPPCPRPRPSVRPRKGVAGEQPGMQPAADKGIKGSGMAGTTGAEAQPVQAGPALSAAAADTSNQPADCSVPAAAAAAGAGVTGSTGPAPMQVEADDSDDSEYVYDVYIATADVPLAGGADALGCAPPGTSSLDPDDDGVPVVAVSGITYSIQSIVLCCCAASKVWMSEICMFTSHWAPVASALNVSSYRRFDVVMARSCAEVALGTGTPHSYCVRLALSYNIVFACSMQVAEDGEARSLCSQVLARSTIHLAVIRLMCRWLIMMTSSTGKVWMARLAVGLTAKTPMQRIITAMSEWRQQIS